MRLLRVRGGEGLGKLREVVDPENLKMHAARGRRRLRGLHLHRAAGRVPQRSNAGQSRPRLVEQLEQFAAVLRKVEENPGHIAAGMREALGEAGLDRIGFEVERHDRNRRGRRSRGAQGDRADGQHGAYARPHQLLRERGQLTVVGGDADRQGIILSLDKAVGVQRLPDQLGARLGGGDRARIEQHDLGNLAGLRKRDSGNADRCSEAGNKRPPLHAVTPSRNRRPAAAPTA